MQTKRQHILSILSKLPLLVLYALFFLVQLFYNFDIPAQPASSTMAFLLQQPIMPEGGSASIKKAAIPANQKTSFRLNKRYQPQPAITGTPIIIRQLVCIVSSKLHVHYSSGFTPSAFPIVQALRGPPVV